MTLHHNLQLVLSKTIRNGDIFSVDFMKCDAILWHSQYFWGTLSEFREQLSRVWLYLLCLLCADIIDGYSFVETWTFWHSCIFHCETLQGMLQLCTPLVCNVPNWCNVDAIGESNWCEGVTGAGIALLVIDVEYWCCVHGIQGFELKHQQWFNYLLVIKVVVMLWCSTFD